MARLGFIGAGKMAYALIKSIQRSDLENSITASARTDETLRYVRRNANVKATKDNKEVVRNSNIVFLCVKPKDMANMLDEIKGAVTNNHIIVSIAAGITLSYLESKLKGKKVIRVMPNIPCMVNAMAAGYAVGRNVKAPDIKLIDKLLSSAGMAVMVKEKDLDAVTALSGSGPAFFAKFIEGMAMAAAKQGLDEKIALKLACQTALGTGKLILEKGMKPNELIKMVASKGGTTEAGLKVLEKNNIEGILRKTIGAAAKRSKELGKK